MSFLGQLKERNVFRIGMAYIVASWVLVQILDVALQPFAPPEWILKFIVFLCFAGFPFALWLSWAFALTPEGLRLEKHVDRSQFANNNAGQKLDYIVVTLLAAVVGLEVMERFMPMDEEIAAQREARTQVMQEAPAPVAVAEPEEPVVILPNSIAVLPFENLSADPTQAYFSDGLADELLNALTRVDGLNVASRTSSFAFRGDTRSVQQIARALRVAHVLEGSVRKAGDRLRVTAQLIDPVDGVNVWSESYDRDLVDIFLVQEEIANAIVAALTMELGASLAEVNMASGTANIDAYDLYLRGRELFIARESLPTSWELLNQATRLDPDFARAWETLAAVHSVATSWLPGDGMDHDGLALEAARRALELDPDLSTPYAVIGMKHVRTGEGYTGAIARLDSAIENDNRNATAYLWRGIKLAELGYSDRALDDFEACMSLDPAYLNCQQWRATALLGMGRVQEAVAQFEATLKYNFHSASESFVSYYVTTGQLDKAYMLAALALRTQFAPVGDWVAAIENPEADHAAGLARFEEWGRPHNMDVCNMGAVAVAFKQLDCLTTVENAQLLWHPDSAAFRQTPEFKTWVAAQLWDYWQAQGLPSQCQMVGEDDFTCD